VIKQAIEHHDQAALEKVAKDQAERGASYIDVNAGVFVGREAEYLEWMVKLVQGVVDVPCCIDSPDPKAIKPWPPTRALQWSIPSRLRRNGTKNCCR
jgi:5-methyltetrahydrofolate corrinoid/iron sulfur protein methyltransferase